MMVSVRFDVKRERELRVTFEHLESFIFWFLFFSLLFMLSLSFFFLVFVLSLLFECEIYAILFRTPEVFPFHSNVQRQWNTSFWTIFNATKVFTKENNYYAYFMLLYNVYGWKRENENTRRTMSQPPFETEKFIEYAQLHKKRRHAQFWKTEFYTMNMI